MSTESARELPMRVGVVFAAFPASDLTPYKVFVLLLNRLQSSCEFEIFDFDADDDEFIEKLEGETVDKDEARAGLEEFGARIRNQISEDMKDFDLATDMPDHIIVVTGATLTDFYYLIRRKQTTMLALGEWEKTMAPPSLAEFMQLQVLRAPYSALEGYVWKEGHLGCRACVFDFSDNLENARLMALAGVGVCAKCAAALRRDGFHNAADEIRHVASHEWRGDQTQPGSAASMMGRLGYDLFLTKGFESSVWERLRRILVDDSAKGLVKLVLGVLAAYALVQLGLKVP